MTPEEFRSAGHALIDWIADHRSRIPDLPVRSQVVPGQIAAALPDAAPQHPESFDAVLADLERIVVPGITQTQSPNFYGWFPSNASLSSVLGDLASGGLGALGVTWASAPALTEVELVVTDWLRVETGLSAQWHGALHDSASTACLVALLAARERATGHSAIDGGLQAQPAPALVYTSPHAHSSVVKAVALAGFGLANLRTVSVDPITQAMRPEALREALTADRAAGLRPAAVVASVGTTATTAIDPLPEIVAVLDELWPDAVAGSGVPTDGAGEANATSRPWLHVDAAMAGAAMLLPERRAMFGGEAGIERADSLSWNPHKWLGTIVDCALLYVRDPDQLVRVMSTDPSYLRSSTDQALAEAGVPQYKDWGIPLGRRFRALKLWFQLRLEGLEPVRARLRRDLANALALAEQVRAEPDWRLVAPVTLQTICLRHEPIGQDGEVLAGADLDEHTLAWVEAVNSSGRAFLTPAQLDGRWMVRVSLGVEATERHHVDALWDLMRQTANERALQQSGTAP